MLTVFDADTNLPAPQCEIQLYAKDGVYLQQLPRRVGGIFLAAANRAEVLFRCAGPPGKKYVMTSRTCEPFSSDCFGYKGDDIPVDRVNHIGPFFQDVLWTIELTQPLPYPPGAPLISPIAERACTPLRPGYAADLRDANIAAANATAKLTSINLAYGGLNFNVTPPGLPKEAFYYACAYTNNASEAGTPFVFPDPSPIQLELGKIVQVGVGRGGAATRGQRWERRPRLRRPL